MKNNIKYTLLFFFFLSLYACSEPGQVTTKDEREPMPAAPSSSEKQEEFPTPNSPSSDTKPGSVEPYELIFLTHEGEWFELEYPKGFSIKKQENKMEKEDPYRGDISVFFTSPDKKITFFTFPIYGHSNPKDIAINEATEEYIDNSQHKQGALVKIRAKDGSYTREYTYDEFHFRGQQYDDANTKVLYSKAFEKFSESIFATE